MNRRQSLILIFICITFFSATAHSGMVAFFDRVDGTCPSGWTPMSSAQGRLIRGTTASGSVGNSVGTPIRNRTAPTHAHSINIDVVAESKKVVAVEEFWPFGQNTQVAAGQAKFQNKVDAFQTGESDGNIPYMQMVVCEEITPGDSIAAGFMRSEMVAFFNDASCPANWELYEKLNKRFIVPAPDNTESGQYGQEVGNLETSHNHGISVHSGQVEPNRVSIGLRPIGMNASKTGWFVKERDGWAKNESPIASMTTSPQAAAETVPYVELLPCRKTSGRARTSQLPEYMMAFMSAEACPNGWVEKSSSHGRYLVGLPNEQHAKSGSTFGGAPLSSGELRTHDHSVNIRFNWPSMPFVGATGDVNKGFAAAGDYDLNGSTQEAAMALPYVQMRQCIVPSKQQQRDSGIAQ